MTILKFILIVLYLLITFHLTLRVCENVNSKTFFGLVLKMVFIIMLSAMWPILFILSLLIYPRIKPPEDKKNGN